MDPANSVSGLLKSVYPTSMPRIKYGLRTSYAFVIDSRSGQHRRKGDYGTPSEVDVVLFVLDSMMVGRFFRLSPTSIFYYLSELTSWEQLHFSDD
jgi:hypothetical protein